MPERNSLKTTVSAAALWAVGVSVRCAIGLGAIRLFAYFAPPVPDGESLLDKSILEATVGDLCFAVLILVIVSAAFWSLILGKTDS